MSRLIATVMIIVSGVTSALFSQIFIPVGGNGWTDGGARITDLGLVDWTNTASVTRIYFKLEKTGSLKIALLHQPQGTPAKIKVTLLGKSFETAVEGSQEKETAFGEWRIEQPGYHCVQVRGVAASGKNLGVLRGLTLSGQAAEGKVSMIPDNSGGMFHWGRRGPSTHLHFAAPEIKDIEWFYSEVTVPETNDVVGSFFMANGFAQGYFGMQVNSPSERRILFSVWSPFQTDDPKNIPAADKIILLNKGPGVRVGEFGNEGSGGQSILVYPWKAGTTYRFLLRGKPDEAGSTLFSGYFFAPEEGKWRLIAGFRRPKISTHLKGLHSFLENFNPDTGDLERSARYGNQWMRDTAGNWSEVSRTFYTGDATARKGCRMDFAGGAEGKHFFLKIGGFFDRFTPLDQTFDRAPVGRIPDIDFNTLP